jgi:TAT (twin-arginine translocation) pathway signal sequence
MSSQQTPPAAHQGGTMLSRRNFLNATLGASAGMALASQGPR